MASGKIQKYRNIVVYRTPTQSSGTMAKLSATTLGFDSGSYLTTEYDIVNAIPMCDNGWCKATVANIATNENNQFVCFAAVYNGHSTESRTFNVFVDFILMKK